MSDSEYTFKNQSDIQKIKDGSPTQNYTDRALAGKITEQIGTGSNAKDSFIWMTITWSFYIATAISVLFFFRSLIPDYNKIESLEYIKDIWDIFVPIITLALGYAFGKGQ